MSVRKRLLSDGRICWQVDYKDGAGIRRHRQFQTKREAEAFHVKARSEVVAGIHTPDSASITVAEAADLWIARCERDELERTTILAYRQHLDNRQALELTGMEATQAARAVALFKAHDESLMDEQYAVRQDEAQLIQTAAQAAAQLREVFDADVKEGGDPVAADTDKG